MTQSNLRNGKKLRRDSAEAYLNFANQYHRAATALLPQREQVAAPLYFLYTHAIELALKAYLRTRDVEFNVKHDLGGLLDLCRGNGASPGQHLTNVIKLLETENNKAGFRYFLPKSTSLPTIDYVAEVVDELIPKVALEVERHPTPNVNQRGAIKFVFGRPIKKRL
jgi:hypothetical protein